MGCAQFVNFASAIDEDDCNISKYFDVEHDSPSHPPVKLAPLYILPKGLGSFVTTSKPMGGSSLKIIQSSQVKASPSEPTVSKQVEPSISTSTRRITQNSLQGMPVSTISSRSCELLNQLSNSIKITSASTISRLSIVDGINVELNQEKEHLMATRVDKKQQPPIHLRARSVPRLQQNRSLVASPTKSKPDLKSRVRARSVSKDRTGTSSRMKNEPDRFVSLSDVLNKAQTKSPTPFKLRRNSPSKATNGPSKPLRAVVPSTTEIETRLRNITTTAESTTTNRKLNGAPGNVLKPLNSVEKRKSTIPAPFKLTEVRKKEVTPSEPFKFTARPVPKSVLEPSNKAADKRITPNKGTTPNKSHTPRKKMLAFLKETSDGRRVLEERDVSRFYGVEFSAKRKLTEPKPFSFDVREQERLARKNARLQEKIESEIRGRPKFQANPLPAFVAVRKRSSSPYSRDPTPVTNGIAGNNIEKNSKGSTVSAVKAPLAPTFRARASLSLTKKPSEPLKPQQHLPLSSVALVSEIRAKKKEDNDKKQSENKAEILASVRR